MKTKEKSSFRLRLAAILFSGFFVAMGTALVVYIHSSFLETVVSETQVGLVFAAGYFAAMLAMQRYGDLIKRFRNVTTLIWVLLFQMFVTVLMAVNVWAPLTLLCFVLHIVCTTVTIINYDLFLKGLGGTSSTGRLRGLFWTLVNFGFVFSPFFTGQLVSYFGYRAAYMAAAFILIPSIFVIWLAYRNEQDTAVYRRHETVRKTLIRIWRRPNMRGIFSVAVLLYLFYSWMVIYTPLYLLESGFDWEQIGTLFTVMLIPFVLFEYPAGWLADKYFGETELLVLGFAIMALSVLGFLVATEFWVVMLMLFLTRVGASLVEIMRDTYFYKNVAANDLDMIETFRNTSSFGHLTGPVLASIFLWFGLDLPSIFIVLSLLMMVAVCIPESMVDTK
jgi:MFS family permease